MLQRIRDSGRWLFGIVIALIAVSFIFWGIDFNMSGATYAAKVNGEEISLAEFERDFQLQQNEFLELYRVELNEDLRREIRRSVVNDLVQREALAQRVEEAGYRVSDDRLAEFIRSAAAFQVGGEFSMDAYAGQLSLQGMSPTAFEELQRERLELLDLQIGIAESTFLTPAEYRRYVELANQQREIAYALFEVDAFADEVEVTDEAVAAHYEENRDRYVTEEAAAIEYVELRRDDVADNIEVTEEELEAYYERLRDNFRTEEERRARHILVTAEEGETPEQTEARAEQIAERVRGGEDFEALAAELSDDPGTAEQGGDLGWIGPGMLVGPFEDALFAMETGEVRGPVQTDFGYHIIRLDDIRAGEEQSFAEVRDQLLEDYRAERADELFYDRANQLADSAFDAYDALAPVAMALDLPLKMLERLPRSGDSEAFPNPAPIVDAVFGSEDLAGGVNSPMIELSEDHVVVLRVTELFPPEPQPLEEVTDEIRETLTRQRAQEMAAQAAEDFFEALPSDLTPQFLGRGDAGTPTAEAESPAADAPTADAASPAADAPPADDDATPLADEAAEGSDGDEAQPRSPAAALAAMHGGRWIDPRWVQRSDAEVPTAVLAEAFGLPAPTDDELVEPVELTTGDHAVLVLAGVQPGQPDAIAQDQRGQIQQQLVDQVGRAELSSYAQGILEQAEVQVPESTLEPQF
jgi:peptidyl-prolyl cis-trans isomerase D